MIKFGAILLFLPILISTLTVLQSFLRPCLSGTGAMGQPGDHGSGGVLPADVDEVNVVLFVRGIEKIAGEHDEAEEEALARTFLDIAVNAVENKADERDENAAENPFGDGAAVAADVGFLVEVGKQGVNLCCIVVAQKVV